MSDTPLVQLVTMYSPIPFIFITKNPERIHLLKPPEDPASPSPCPIELVPLRILQPPHDS